MRQLTKEEIKKLASVPGVRRIAVENFLFTLTNNRTPGEALRNLEYDAKLYKWDAKTVGVIKKGIRMAMREDINATT